MIFPFLVRPAALALAVGGALSFPALSQTTLTEIIVTGNRQEQALHTAPIGASVITAQDIRRSGASDANEAIRLLGGVVSRRDLNGGREATLDLRGFGDAASSNVVVLVDGVRISENELAGARLSALSAEMIERIEIVRGGSSVLWGEGASAGVIHVITKRGSRSGAAQGAATLGLEIFGGREVRAGVSAGQGKIDFSAQARSYRTDGERDNSAHKNDSLNLGLGLGDRKTLRADITAFSENSELRWPGPLPLAAFQDDPLQSRTPLDRGNQKQERLTLSLQRELGSGMLSVDLTRRHRRASSFQDYGMFGFGTNASDSVGLQLAPRLSWTHDWGSAVLTTLAGLDVNRWDYERDTDGTFGASNEIGKQKSRAWYLRGDLALASDWRVNAGVRSEKFSREFENTTFSSRLEDDPSLSAVELGVSRAFGPNWTVYSRAASSYRVANVDEQRFLASPLVPQKARDLEVGLRFRRDGTAISARAFQQKTRDEIAYDNPTFSNVNLDPVKRRGIEFEGSQDIGAKWKVAATLQAINTRFDAGVYEGNRLPLASPWAALVRTTYAPSAANSFDLVLRAVGKTTFGNDSTNSCNRIPERKFVDVAYRYEASPLTGWAFRAGIDNLLDKQAYSAGYTNSACSAYNVYPDQGRLVKLSATYRF